MRRTLNSLAGSAFNLLFSSLLAFACASIATARHGDFAMGSGQYYSVFHRWYC